MDATNTEAPWGRDVQINKSVYVAVNYFYLRQLAKSFTFNCENAWSVMSLWRTSRGLNFADASCEVSVFVWISRGANSMHRVPQSVKIGESCNVKRRLDEREISWEHNITKFEGKFQRKNRYKCYHGFRRSRRETFPKMRTSKPSPSLMRVWGLRS